MRNSRHPEGPALVYTRAEMEALILGVKDGEFDHLMRELEELEERHPGLRTGFRRAVRGNDLVVDEGVSMSEDVRPLAVVTGGSNGIGEHLARQFASNGFDVLVANEDDGVETVRT